VNGSAMTSTYQLELAHQNMMAQSRGGHRVNTAECQALLRGVKPVLAAAALLPSKIRGNTSVHFHPLYHHPGVPALRVSNSTMEVRQMGTELLAESKAVAINIPAGVGQSFERVETCLSSDRAMQILRRKLESMMPATDYSVWIEHAEPGMAARPNYLSRPQRAVAALEIDEEFEAQTSRDYARARAEVHSIHRQKCVELLLQAEDVATNIPPHVPEYESRLKSAVETVQRCKQQIESCDLGVQLARRDFY